MSCVVGIEVPHLALSRNVFGMCRRPISSHFEMTQMSWLEPPIVTSRTPPQTFPHTQNEPGRPVERGDARNESGDLIGPTRTLNFKGGPPPQPPWQPHAEY